MQEVRGSSLVMLTGTDKSRHSVASHICIKDQCFVVLWVQRMQNSLSLRSERSAHELLLFTLGKMACENTLQLLLHPDVCVFCFVFLCGEGWGGVCLVGVMRVRACADPARGDQP